MGPIELIKGFIFDVVGGLRERYPLCCIIAYCLGARALEDGVVYRDDNPYDAYVPCFLHRKRAITFYDHLKILNGGNLGWFVHHGKLR